MLTIKKSTQSSLIPVRLGGLMINAGIVRADQMALALAEARRNNQKLGEVLVSQKLASEEDMTNALSLQELIKAGKITSELAMQALKMAHQKQRNIHAALADLGWRDENAIQTIDLSAVIIESGLASRDQINQASWNTQKNGLPLGRNLVLAGALSPSLLGSALTALVLLRDKTTSRDRVLEGLRRAAHYKKTLEDCLCLNADQNHVRVGELLSGAGLLTESDAMIAVENGLLDQKSIGQVLLESKMVTPLVLDATLKLQKMIEEKRMAKPQATEFLRQVASKQIGLDQFLNELSSLKSRVLEFLLHTGLVIQEDIESAIALNVEYEDDMIRALGAYGALSQDLFKAAVRCIYAIDSGNYTLDEMSVSLRTQFTRSIRTA